MSKQKAGIKEHKTKGTDAKLRKLQNKAPNFSHNIAYNKTLTFNQYKGDLNTLLCPPKPVHLPRRTIYKYYKTAATRVT